jgi:hypothetical protein
MNSTNLLRRAIATSLLFAGSVAVIPAAFGGGLGSTVGGGVGNHANGDYATVAGGVLNYADGTNSVVAGGDSNHAEGINSVVAGGYTNNAAAQNATIGGGYNNYAIESATIAGGEDNTTFGVFGTIGGGEANQATQQYSTVAGGNSNTADGLSASVGGGDTNIASDAFATIAGGQNNQAGLYASVGGGTENHATGFDSTISGGAHNDASGVNAVVPGGEGNTAAGDFSFAGGIGSTTRSAAQSGTPGGDSGSFVWSDGQTGGLSSNGSKQFIVGANGGFGLNTAPINSSVAMTIAATAANPNYAGILLRSAASPDGMLIFSGGATPGANNAFLYIDQANGLTSTHRLTLDGVGRLFISNQAYKPGGGSWAASSDARLKTNVKPLGRALDQMLALKGVTFEYAHPDGGMHPGGTFSGFIAQDVEKVFPNWIGHDNDGYLTVGPQGFEALTVEALRELKTSEDDRVAKLERENADLHELVANQTKAISELRREVAAVVDAGRLESRQIAAADSNP